MESTLVRPRLPAYFSGRFERAQAGAEMLVGESEGRDCQRRDGWTGRGAAGDGLEADEAADVRRTDDERRVGLLVVAGHLPPPHQRVCLRLGATRWERGPCPASAAGVGRLNDQLLELRGPKVERFAGDGGSVNHGQ